MTKKSLGGSMLQPSPYYTDGQSGSGLVVVGSKDEKANKLVCYCFHSHGTPELPSVSFNGVPCHRQLNAQIIKKKKKKL